MTNEMKERNWWTESSPCVSRNISGTSLCDPGMWCALSGIPDLGKWVRETRGAKEGFPAGLLMLMAGWWRMLVNPALRMWRGRMYEAKPVSSEVLEVSYENNNGTMGE